MLIINTIASGSAGNCYSISDGETMLLIEAGINIKKIMQGLNYGLSGVRGLLLSHEHQ